jgi:hypothetical protein
MSSPLVAVSQCDPVEEEFAKDVWNVRRIPGARYAAHKSDHMLNFTHIPSAFRPVVKRFLRFRLVQHSHSNCQTTLRYLQIFLEFYVAFHATANDFRLLDRRDIEAYLLYLRGTIGTKNRYGKEITRSHMWEAVTQLWHFLDYLERTSSTEAPLTPVGKLIWPGDTHAMRNELLICSKQR